MSCVVAGIPLRWHTVIPGRPPGGLGVFVPVDSNAVLEDFGDEEFVATDERIPYFCTLWPAAEALAARIMAGPSLEGMRVLDLGCGIGVVGLAAARKCARVTFLDWEPRAREMVELSARALGLDIDAALACDWRSPPPLEPFDRIFAADVLYEVRNLAAVAGFLAGHLRKGTEAWVADPGRNTAVQFPDELRNVGLRIAGRDSAKDSEGNAITILKVA